MAITWQPQGDRYTRTDGNLEATLTLTSEGWKYEVWDMGVSPPKWVASGYEGQGTDAEAMAEQAMQSNQTKPKTERIRDGIKALIN